MAITSGCTWAGLYAELHPLGLRAPLWGTLSGVRATVGGGAGQNGTFWGARNGTIAGSVLGYTDAYASAYGAAVQNELTPVSVH